MSEIGKIYGKIKILKYLPIYIVPCGAKIKKILGQCNCGVIKQFRLNDLRNGHTKSCGCYKKEKSTKHGYHKTKTYCSWVCMLSRCNNSNYRRYKDYGGRGITVCKRWLKFENFLVDMSNRPEGKTLDRINNNGNYCKSNCRWATSKIQTRNRKTNRKYKGECATDASIRLGGNKSLVNARVRLGWGLKKAFTTLSGEK